MLVRQLEASQWLDGETLRARQFAHLGQAAPWLAAHSPAFARRLRAAGLEAGALATPEGFAALPVVSRRWFQDEPDIGCDAVPEGHLPLGEVTTSGSTGEVLRVRKTQINHLVWLAMVFREHGWIGSDFSVRLAIVRATGTGIKRFTTWGLPATLLFNTGQAMTMHCAIPGKSLLAELEAFGAGHLLIFPNALHTVLEAAEARSVPLPRLRHIRTVGETVTPALRERARAVLGLEIHDAYSCEEAGYLALQCPESGLYHVMAESVIVEVLREDGTPCAEGEVGRVAITDLFNHATPVVRYAHGDFAERGGPCPCGRGLPTLKHIVGRERNLIRMPDGSRVWPSMGGFGPEGFLKILPVRQFQYIQTEHDLIEVRLVTARPLSTDEEQVLVAALHKGLCHPFRTVLRYFDDRLPLPKSGKFEDFVCQV